MYISAPSLLLYYVRKSCKWGKTKNSQLLNLFNMGHLGGLNERKHISLCIFSLKNTDNRGRTGYLWRDLGLHFLILDLKIFVFIHKFLWSSMWGALFITAIPLFPVDIFSCVLCSWPEPGPAETHRAYYAWTPPWTPQLSVPVALWTPLLQSDCCVESGSP